MQRGRDTVADSETQWQRDSDKVAERKRHSSRETELSNRDRDTVAERQIHSDRETET